MVIKKGNTSLQQLWPLWRIIMTGLITLALVISTILSWHYLTGGSMAGCGGGSPCDYVLNSRWSLLAGLLPVSGLAVGAYFAMLVSSFFIGADTEISIRRLAWGAILVISGSVAGSAVWFSVLQKWFIGEFCPYCMAAHTTGILLTALIIWRVFNESEGHTKNLSKTKHINDKVVSQQSQKRIIRPQYAVGFLFSGLVIAGILAAIQFGFTPSAVNHEGESQENQVIIDYYNVPIVGSPDAPYKVTILFDYQCSHCQKIHFMLDEAVRRYDGKLAFVLCPAPLNSTCNPYIFQDVEAFKNSCELTKISLAVWFAKRGAFNDFENWMFTFESGDRWSPRSLESARAKAVELVGQKAFDAALSDPWIEQYLQQSIRIYGQTIQGGRSGIPKMIYGSQWIIPEPYNAVELVSILQKSLAVPLP